MKTILTGSRVYGTPTAESDLDLVVLVTPEERAVLTSLEAPGSPDAKASGQGDSAISASLRFGRLNLIVVTSEETFTAWRLGTEMLKAKRPVTRPEAVAAFKVLFKALKDGE